MPIRKIQRRTLSKVEQQLLKEKEEETTRIKQQKKNDWIKRQIEYKKHNKNTNVNENKSVKKQTPYSIVKEPVININTIKNKETNYIVNYNWTCLNNSWADQSEFENIRKQILLRIAYKMMKD